MAFSQVDYIKYHQYKFAILNFSNEEIAHEKRKTSSLDDSRRANLKDTGSAENRRG